MLAIRELLRLMTDRRAGDIDERTIKRPQNKPKGTSTRTNRRALITKPM